MKLKKKILSLVLISGISLVTVACGYNNDNDVKEVP